MAYYINSIQRNIRSNLAHFDLASKKSNAQQLCGLNIEYPYNF